MSTAPDQSKSDLEIICRAIAEGRKVDPKIVERVRRQAAAVRRKLDFELSVELVRAVRDDDE